MGDLDMDSFMAGVILTVALCAGSFYIGTLF